jgi:hypothetical protein
MFFVQSIRRGADIGPREGGKVPIFTSPARRGAVRLLLAAFFLVAAICGQSVLAAEFTSKDIQIAVRTLRFLIDPPTAKSPIAVLFDPTNRERAAAAQMMYAALVKEVGDEKAVRIVPITALEKLDGVGSVLLTDGLEAHYSQIFAATSERRIVSISTDPECIKQNLCVMSLTTEPRVRIVLSRAATEASRLTFQSAFRLMVSEY